MLDDAVDASSASPSKSARKREMTALQVLGEALCDLSAKELASIPIEDERLLSAIQEAGRIRSHSALRRHRQFIGKLMREVDPQPLQAALDALYARQRAATHAFHELETLRDRLCLQGDKALSEVLARFPHADRQHLRQLMREAQRVAETPSGRPNASRRLFRYLRELQESQA